MSEVKPKVELKVFGVFGTEDAAKLETLLTEGWRPDPVLMPTGRPNIVEQGAIYHLIKFPADKKEAELALLEYSDSQPTYSWNHIEGVKDLIHKREMQLKQAQIDLDHPVPTPVEEDVILGTVYVEHGKDQEQFKQRGYFVAHKDHITAKGTIMSQMGKRPKPKEPEDPMKASCPLGVTQDLATQHANCASCDKLIPLGDNTPPHCSWGGWPVFEKPLEQPSSPT